MPCAAQWVTHSTCLNDQLEVKMQRITSHRVEPAAGRAMSASHPKRPSAMKMRSVAKGQLRHFAVQKDSKPFRVGPP